MALFDTGTGLGNLFDGMNIFGARPSEALTGILTQDQQDKLKNQAFLQGVLGTAANYFAQPKNLGVRSALPYLAKAYVGGMGSSQNVYDQALMGKVKQLELEQGAKRLEMEGLTPLEKLMRRREILAKANPNDPQLQKLDLAIDKESGALTGFGAGVEGSSLSILARGSQNTPEGEAIRKTPQYALAYRNQTSPKTIMQETMDENGNVYTVPVKIQPSTLPPNILPPVQEGVTTQPVDMTQPQITTKPGQVTQPVAQQTQTPIVKKQAQTKQDIFKQEQDLRKQYQDTPEVKNFGEVRSAYNIINKSLSNASPAGDLAGATKFMKLLDPTSVVRDTELRLAMEATGVVDRAQNYFNMLATGQKLNPTQRQDFLNVANKLYQAAEEVKNKYDMQYAEIAKTNKLDPSKVIMGYKEKTPSSQVRNKEDILKAYGVQ